MDVEFRRIIAAARKHGDLYFATLLAPEYIADAFGKASWFWQGWVYSPTFTIWVWLSQCLSPDHSCREAVAGLLDWRWRGRRVLTVDGTTVTMPDTDANQQAYPQLAAQQPGCGFPIARMVVVFSLTVGTVINAAIGKYQGKQTGENSLFRTLFDSLRNSDVLVADRCFSGWFDIALLKQRGVDMVVRKHQLRPTDFRAGVRIGRCDHLIMLPKPQRPTWMNIEQYESLPNWLTLRELRVEVPQAGFRTTQLGQ